MKFWGYDKNSKTMLECVLTSVSFNYSSDDGNITGLKAVGVPFTAENEPVVEKVFDEIYKDKNGNEPILISDLITQLRLMVKNQDERSNWKLDNYKAKQIKFTKGYTSNPEIWFVENGIIRKSTTWVIQSLDVTNNDIAFMTINVIDSNISLKNYYPSKEACLCFEKINAIDIEGNVSFIGGYADEVKLSAEELNLLLDLQTVLEKINNRNISIIYNESTGKYIAGKGDITSIYSPDIDEEYMKENNEVVITDDCLIELPVPIARTVKDYDDDLILRRK